MKSKVVAKAVIFNESGQVLLLRRSSDDPQRPGEQDFPGGGVDQGEQLNHAISREIREETGLTVDAGRLELIYAATEFYAPTGRRAGESVTRLLFWAKVTAAEVTMSSEHDEYHWTDPAQAVIEFPHPFYGAGLAYALEHGLIDYEAP